MAGETVQAAPTTTGTPGGTDAAAPANTTPSTAAAPVEAVKPAADKPLISGTEPKAEVKPDAKADDKKADADKAKATEPAAELKLKLPEGVDAKDPVISEFLPIAKELGLDSEKAQKLVDLYVKAQAPMREAIAKHDAEKKGWRAAVQNDPEIGGAKFDASIRLANLGAEKIGGRAFIDLVNAYNLGDHPVLVKALVKAGQLVSEDRIAGTNGGAKAVNDSEAQLRAAYPTMFKA